MNKIIVYSKFSSIKDGKIFVKEEDFTIPFGIEAFKLSLTEFNNIQKKLIQSKELFSNFNHEDYSLWWFIHPSIYPEIKNNINFIYKFNKFLESEHPSRLLIQDDFSKFDIIKQICMKKKIPLQYSKKNLIKFKLKNYIKNTLNEIRFSKIFKNKLKIRKNSFFKKERKIPLLSKKIIFAIPTIYRRQIIDSNGKTFNGEYIQENIINLIQNKSEILGIDIDYTFKGDFNTFFDRLSSNLFWIPIESFIKINFSKKNNFYKKKYQMIINNKKFQNLFFYDGINLWSSLAFTFKKMLFAPHLPFYVNLMKNFEIIFENEKPRAIFLPYETGPIALSLILSAKKHSIKTIGIQHAIISNYNPMYSYPLLSNLDNLGFPIPDNMLVFGEYSKNMLIEYGYDENRVKVLGNAAFFNLNKIFDHFESNNSPSKFNLPSEKILILFTTEYLQEYYKSQGKFNYDTAILNELIKNFSNDDKYFIIIKPHPTEITTIYENIIKLNQSQNFKIIQDNLFELIHISDIVISVYSNSMTDAICLGKPVIRVEFDGVKHVVPYDDYGVLITSSLSELNQKIRNLEDNENLKNELKKNSKKFIKIMYGIPESNPSNIINELLD